MDELVLIAKIKSVQRNGFTSIKSFSQNPERFLGLESAVIEIFGTMRPIIISDSVVNRKEILLKFENFNTADEASALLNCKLFVHGSEKIQLPADTFFIHDLVGCKVYKGSKFIGNLIDVLTLPANDVYVIEDNDKNEIIVPATKDAVKSIDVENKTIILNENFELMDENED